MKGPQGRDHTIVRSLPVASKARSGYDVHMVNYAFAFVPALVLTLALASCGGADRVQSGYDGPDGSRPTGSASISPNGLVASYPMSLGTDGSLVDLGPNGLHGRVLRSQTVPGIHGEARRFTTVEDRVDLPEHVSFDLDGPLTIATWVRVDSLGLHQHIVACDDKWALWITPGDQYRLGDTRGGGWSTREGRVAAGRWTPVVAVLDGTRGDPLGPETVALWVDGEPAQAYRHLRSEAAEQAGAWSPGDLYPTDACSIGFESHQGNEAHQAMPFVGAIDDLLIFSRAWSDEETRAFSRLPVDARFP